MEEYLINLQSKYGYDEKIIKALSMIIPVLIQYFGEENQNLIFSAIDDCPIYINKENKDPKEFLSAYFPNKDINGMMGNSEALYESGPILENNCLKTKRLIFINKANWSYDYEENLGILVHELCHLIKSYKQEYQRVDGILYQRSGLCKIKHKTINGETIKFECFSIKGLGLEETINYHDEEEIMKLILNKDYKSSAPDSLSRIAEVIFSNEFLVNMIRKEQFSVTSELEENIGTIDYDTIIENLDSIIATIYFASFREMVSNDKKRARFNALVDESIDLLGKYKTKIF